MIQCVKSRRVSNFSRFFGAIRRHGMAFLNRPAPDWQNPRVRTRLKTPKSGTKRLISASTSLTVEMSPNRQRFLVLLAAASCGALSSAPALAETYGKLIVRHSAAPATMLETRFSRVRAAHSFLLVVTEPAREPLSFSWSVRCTGAARGESGGASGRATIANGHWVKRIVPNWIKHPVSCSGSISGAAAGAPVLVRVFSGS